MNRRDKTRFVPKVLGQIEFCGLWWRYLAEQPCFQAFNPPKCGIFEAGTITFVTFLQMPQTDKTAAAAAAMMDRRQEDPWTEPTRS
ncbi:hypothetical protein [Brevirhabdus sp.]|uniref:hypothetical protein n=1 Tax=Brevirhabdus sp. TaxID=2004514 RepID=UPI00405956D6